MRRPTKPFRIIRGESADYASEYFTTAEERDKAAHVHANQDLGTVIVEEWDADIASKCDPINQGWGCVGTVEPQKPVGWVIETYEDGTVLWWSNDDGWVEMLNDGADVYTDLERYERRLPLNGQWVEVYTHGGGDNGVLTTEPCLGPACQDCLGAAASVRS